LALVNHDLHHLLADQFLLGRLCVAGSLHLVLVASGESDAEHSEQVSILSFGLCKSFDQSVPLLQEGARLVSCDVQSMEISVSIKSFNFFALDLYFPPRLFVGFTVQVGQ